MARTDTLGNFLTDVCNAVREKTGETGTIKASELDTKIQNISSGDIPANAKIEIAKYDDNGYPIKVIVRSTYVSSYMFYCPINNTSYTYNKMEEVVLPDDITNIGEWCFYNCANLKTINIPDAVTSFGKSCFEGCLAVEITLPPSIKTLNQACFKGCKKLQASSLPETVTYMSDNVFNNCDSITTFTMPSTIKQIPISTLRDCDNLTSVTLLADVTSIGGYCFNASKNFETLIMPNITSVPTVETTSFGGTKISSGIGYIYVPDTLVDSFKTTGNWVNYANQIKPISELETE